MGDEENALDRTVQKPTTAYDIPDIDFEVSHQYLTEFMKLRKNLIVP
jgi:hypothetical protein